MEVRLFGELEAVAAGVPVPVRGAKQLALLTLVAIESRAGAELGLGRHGELAGELEALCRQLAA